MSVRSTLAGLGFPLESSHGASDYFCRATIQVEYGPDDSAWFIGVSSSDQITTTYRGRNPFDLAATEFFALVAAHDDSGPHEFDRYEYVFPNQILTLWDADEQYDRKGGEARPVWAQVGLGTEAYAAVHRTRS